METIYITSAVLIVQKQRSVSCAADLVPKSSNKDIYGKHFHKELSSPIIRIQKVHSSNYVYWGGVIYHF